jgi:hypothetical protein
VAIGATGAAASHWSFGQLCSLASPGNSPASYFRETNMPSPMIADCLNYNLRFTRGVEDIGVLLTQKGDYDNELRSVNGPNYGRIYDADVVDSLVDKFGDGVYGTWRVPGEFGQRVAVTKDNTTLYASDRDMFAFLAGEENRIEIPGRRAGKSGASPGASSYGTARSARRPLAPASSSSITSAATASYRVPATTPRSASATPRALRTGGSRRSLPS